MSDVGEITSLIHSYGRLLDSGDIEGVIALFEYATWRGDPNGPVLEGSAAIRPVYEQLLVALGSLKTKHLLSNLSIDVDEGGNTASSHCYWTVLQNTEPGRSIDVTLSGEYTDRFEKLHGKWCFSDRLITTDLFGNATTA